MFRIHTVNYLKSFEKYSKSVHYSRQSITIIYFRSLMSSEFSR